MLNNAGEPPDAGVEGSLREQVAMERGFRLYASYPEKVAAGFAGRHYRTFQKWRLGKAFDEIRSARGTDKSDTTYMGYEIADIILGKYRKHRKKAKAEQANAA